MENKTENKKLTLKQKKDAWDILKKKSNCSYCMDEDYFTGLQLICGYCHTYYENVDGNWVIVLYDDDGNKL